jgi:hypothetical protein
MQYENVAALVEQIEALTVSDLSAGLAARLNEVVQRRQRTIAKAQQIYETFVGELELAGYSLSPHSHSTPDYVYVASAELVSWKLACSEELVDQYMALYQARLVDGRWQVSRVFHDCLFEFE